MRVLRLLVTALSISVCCSSFVLVPSCTYYYHHVKSSNSLLFAKVSTNDDSNEQRKPLSKERTKWFTCSSTRELQMAVELLVRDTDVVAEIGAQLRNVSTTIGNRAQSAVLVDVERKFPSDAKGRTAAMRIDGDVSLIGNGNVVFGEMKSLSDWRKALFFDNGGERSYNVLVLDVSAIVGNDLEWTSFAMIQEFLELNACFGGNCRTVLVKSAGLNRLAACLVHGQVWIDRGPTSSKIKPNIVATVGVQQYRQTMERAVLPGDAVLEVGCHFGTSTVLFHEKAAEGGGYCIGVDVGKSIVDGAKKRHPDVCFDIGDAWKTADLLRIQQEFLASSPDVTNRRRGFDVVYVDVGGLSGGDGILEALMLLSSFEKALEPRCLVIKSQCMRRLSSTLTSFWKSPERQVHDRQQKEELIKTEVS
jgi:hypothetical protein